VPLEFCGIRIIVILISFSMVPIQITLLHRCCHQEPPPKGCVQFPSTFSNFCTAVQRVEQRGNWKWMVARSAPAYTPTDPTRDATARMSHWSPFTTLPPLLWRVCCLLVAPPLAHARWLLCEASSPSSLCTLFAGRATSCTYHQSSRSRERKRQGERVILEHPQW
jgi:hypothetical protein